MKKKIKEPKKLKIDRTIIRELANSEITRVHGGVTGTTHDRENTCQISCGSGCAVCP